MAFDLSRQLVARWPNPDPAHVTLLKEIGVKGVVVDPPHVAFETACADAGLAILSPFDLKGVHAEGLWPGIRREQVRRQDAEELSSASREPWIDSNGWLVAYLRALHPGEVPVLAYQPNEKAGLDASRMVPFETLELGLIEARIGGGNFILALEPRYRAALLQGDTGARRAWSALGRTAVWLEKNRNLFGLPVPPTVTIVVEEGDATGEIALLAYRRQVSPALVATARIPAPDPARILVLAAASLAEPAVEIRRRIIDHARAGSTVVIDSAPDGWEVKGTPTRIDEDRKFYTVGRGRVVAYNDEIYDQSEFALDLIDLVTHPRRSVRIWNALSAIPLAMVGPGPGEVTVHVINYGASTRDEVQVRVQGHFAAATVLTPDQADAPLKVARRGPTTEVFIPRLNRVATIRFSGGRPTGRLNWKKGERA